MSLLRSSGEDWWAEWVERDRRRIQLGDYDGLVSLLGEFGGMGSINDLMIHPDNGHVIAPDEVRPANEHLRELLGEVWTEAREIKRELDRASLS